MEVFKREPTRKTPGLNFDPGSGKFEISGRSFSEEALELYDELYSWLDKYVEVPLSSTSLTFNTDYFNTASYKAFVQIIKKLENIPDSNHEVNIMWSYEKDDEEIREAGENLREITMLPIEVIESGLKAKK